MDPPLLTDTERKILSYCVRGAPTTTAVDKMSEFFGMSKPEVTDALKKLRTKGLIIEAKIASLSAYTTNPIKVKSAMVDQRIVEQVANRERGTAAGGWKKKTFDANTGAVTSQPSKPREKVRSRGEFDFDVE